MFVRQHELIPTAGNRLGQLLSRFYCVQDRDKNKIDSSSPEIIVTYCFSVFINSLIVYDSFCIQH